MKVTYSTKTSEAKITLSYAEIRDFLSQSAAVEAVRNAVRTAMKP